MSSDLTSGGMDSGESSRGEYEGFSDYYHISRKMSESIDDAIRAYAYVDSLYIEGAQPGPQQCAEARARIMSAALQLVPELEDNSSNEKYDEILSDWLGDDDGDEGYLDELQHTSLYEGVPSWMHEMVTQIRAAGWHLGYLQAGRRSKERETIDDEVESMFEGM